MRPLVELLEDRTVPSFITPLNFAVDKGPAAVIVASFRGNGELDVATANSTGNDVSILLGNNDGTFLPAVNYAVGTAPAAMSRGFRRP